MKAEFIKIASQRIRSSTIKKYQPHGNYILNVYFNTSRYKIELEVFRFDTVKERDEMLNSLDKIFNI